MYAIAKHGRRLSLACRPPAGPKGRVFLERFLAGTEQWKIYADKGTVAIPFDALRPEVQRSVLLAIFKEDTLDERGWTHKVLSSEETLWSLCEWLTDRGTTYRRVMKDNAIHDTTLVPGQEILIATNLLRDVMKPVLLKKKRGGAQDFIELDEARPELAFAFDDEGRYALYQIKANETLYTSVGMRFTDARDHDDIMAVCKVIQERSGIRNARDIDEGTVVHIPVEFLSDRYQPPGSQRRRNYEGVLRQASLLKNTRVGTRDLEGVVVVLDPGHGGKATGTVNKASSLYEDEIVYDICCRIYEILTEKTRAIPYLTVIDRSQGWSPTNRRRFTDDDDEELMTSPTRYNNSSVTASLHLRSYIANSIFRKSLDEGIDARKVIFTSFHADSLGNGKARGTMVYVPGAHTRGLKPVSRQSGFPYTLYNEFKEKPRIASNARQRKLDEALSRNFAETFLDSLRDHNPPIRRHMDSDPIRNKIRQSGGAVYVPSVLKHNDIPTKILIETANMANSTDRKRMADPKWRQWFAEAYVDALRAQFNPRPKVAKATP